MNQIRDLVKKYDLFLFSDEVYREFIYTGSPYISACHLEGIENNVVLIDSVSKHYSECGIRIGALITKNKEIRDAVMKFCQARLTRNQVPDRSCMFGRSAFSFRTVLILHRLIAREKAGMRSTNLCNFPS